MKAQGRGGRRAESGVQEASWPCAKGDQEAKGKGQGKGFAGEAEGEDSAADEGPDDEGCRKGQGQGKGQGKGEGEAVNAAGGAGDTRYKPIDFDHTQYTTTTFQPGKLEARTPLP